MTYCRTLNTWRSYLQAFLLLTNLQDLVEVEEETRIKKNKNGILYIIYMGLDEIIGIVSGGNVPYYIIVLVALLGLAGRNRLHTPIPLYSSCHRVFFMQLPKGTRHLSFSNIFCSDRYCK